MDERVKPAITPLARGEHGTVSTPAVQLLATWATKIALVLDTNHRVISPTVKHSFRNKPHPPAGFTAWLGAMSPADEAVRVLGADFGPFPDTTRGKAFVATFRVLHLVGQVVYAPPHVAMRRGSEFTKGMERIWPRNEKLVWPPPEAWWLENEDEFTYLAQVFEGARKS
ncbi:MAG TPA: hypothetical protein VJ716_03975 [Gaiellaceae bacterium]|nr:hypothetical protein [Gaiellaceae bacterium]